ALVWYWTALSGALLAVARIERRLPIIPIALGALGLAAGAWGAAYVEPADPTPTLLGLSYELLQAVAIAGLAIWGAASLPRSPLWRPAMQTALVFAGLLLFVATSFEAARLARIAFDDVMAQRATISLWWALYGAGLLVLGSLRRWAPCRFAGLGLLGA